MMHRGKEKYLGFMTDFTFSTYEHNFITRLCYEFFFPSARMKAEDPPSLFQCLAGFLRRLRHFIMHPDMKKPAIKQIVFFSTSINNTNALSPVWTKLGNAEYTVWKRDDIFSETAIAIHSFLHLFSFFYFQLNKGEIYFYIFFILKYFFFYFLTKKN